MGNDGKHFSQGDFFRLFIILLDGFFDSEHGQESAGEKNGHEGDGDETIAFDHVANGRQTDDGVAGESADAGEDDHHRGNHVPILFVFGQSRDQ